MCTHNLCFEKNIKDFQRKIVILAAEKIVAYCICLRNEY